MVLLLDLDDEVSDPYADPTEPAGFVLRLRPLDPKPVTGKDENTNEKTVTNERSNPNHHNGLSAAVACYPYCFPPFSHFKNTISI